MKRKPPFALPSLKFEALLLLLYYYCYTLLTLTQVRGIHASGSGSSIELERSSLDKNAASPNQEYESKANHDQIVYGVPQTIVERYEPRISRVLKRTHRYMQKRKGNANNNNEPCQNQHTLCSYWAALDKCNDSFLTLDACRPACMACLETDRCNVFASTDTLVSNSTARKFLARETPSIIEQLYDSFPSDSIEILSEDPLVYQIDNFISFSECKRIIDWAANEQNGDSTAEFFEPSKETFQRNGTRNSDTAWCIHPSCQQVTYNFTRRLEDWWGIPSSHYEHLQILRYRPGQYYRRHHDGQRVPYAGRRLFTAYLYLQEPLEGGETEFPELSIKVKPRAGRLVVWPNYRLTQDSDVASRDILSIVIEEKTDHEAKTVLKGIKYGMNVWVHEQDFKGPWELKCF